MRDYDLVRDRGFLETPPGRGRLASWIFSTDHKRVAILYLASTLAFFAVGAALGLLTHLELLAPGRTVMDARAYGQAFTAHGVVMVFLVIIPAAPGVFGNFLLPLMIGARNVAFPRLNLLAWWLHVAGGALLASSLFLGPGMADTGWTFYVPYSLISGGGVALPLFAVFVLGLSSVLTAVNFITTVHGLRAPGLGWFRLPIFVWSVYAAAWVQLLAAPVLGAAALMVIAERHLGVGVFDPAAGGDPVLYQHLFWIYSHPAAYVMILPAMGAAAEIIPVFARKAAFGYRTVACSCVAMAILGAMAWGQHMFVSGSSQTAGVVFSLFTFLAAVPAAVMVINWAATLHGGSVAAETPLLYALAFVFLLVAGGLTGMMLGALSLNVHLHDTYFVVGHLHYIALGGAVTGFLAALHYWFPKIFGRMYSQGAANAALAVLFVGLNMLCFPMLILGAGGMPRRYYDYLPRYQEMQLLSTVGSWVVAAGLFFVFANLARALLGGGRWAEANPWKAATLEWKTTSPPPEENFKRPPVAARGPYDFKSIDLE